METWKSVSSVLAALLVSGAAFAVLSMDQEESQEWRQNVQGEETEVATFAGGCFWCIEAVYQDVKGVKKAISGYAGGSKENATYQKVKTGETDHREAVQVEYYPSLISYSELLDMYWKSIDPTDAGGQFSDRGDQYTTAIYYHDKEQKRKAEESKKELEQSEKFEEPIVTEIVEYTTFFPAEDYHQNYSEKNTFSYEAYKKGSGRESYLKKLWKKTPLG